MICMENSMNDIIASIYNLADYADNYGHKKLAQDLDAYANSMLNIKIAQYVGGQGYAVRNSRCWSNCYRQKRAQKPEMPAQKVWQECHAEYVASINHDGGKWDKYASGSKLHKTAGNERYAHEIYKMKIAQLIDVQVSNGDTYAHAIESTCKSLDSLLQDEIARTAESMVHIAHAKIDDEIVHASLREIIAQIHGYLTSIQKFAQTAPPAPGTAPSAGAAPVATPAGTLPAPTTPPVNFSATLSVVETGIKSELPNVKTDVQVFNAWNKLKSDIISSKDNVKLLLDAVTVFANTMKTLIGNKNIVARSLYNATLKSGVYRFDTPQQLNVALEQIPNNIRTNRVV